MNIGFLSGKKDTEKRTLLTLKAVKNYTAIGATLLIEPGAGKGVFSDDAYQNEGCKVLQSREEVIKSADIIVQFDSPDPEEVTRFKKGCIHISYLNPFNELEKVRSCYENSITAISLQMIPRTTKAQKMDVLSSQSNLGGYIAVIMAAEKSHKILPMMTTPSGTISPARAFIIGAGVAGLQAIATAKRLGARVFSFDTRPAVEEQVKSLGASFVKVDLGETEETKDGYAKALNSSQLDLQRETMTKFCAQSDMVITTAQIFGKKAPLIITKEMIKKMRPGSVIIDMAVESGGNVEGVVFNEITTIDGVHVIGLANLPSYAAEDASDMLANNVYNIISEYWAKEEKKMEINLEDEILAGCVLTHNQRYINQRVIQLIKDEKVKS